MRCCFLVFTLSIFLTGLSQAQAAPKVIVSIAPIHSLVAGVMAGVGQPDLLIRSTASPHHFSLRPSHMKALAKAQLVVRVGANFERFMNRPLAHPAENRSVLSVIDLPGINLLPYRGMDDHAGHHHDQTMDPHVWLDPNNAQVIVKAIVALLGEIDTTHKMAYQANGLHMLAALQALDEKLKVTLSGVKKVPYLVLHDAYHYFERQYQLNQIGAVILSPERRPGARRLSEIRKTAREEKVNCIFGEPQMPAKYLQGIAEDVGLQLGMLDPLGIGLKEDEKLYFRMMNRLAESLVNCLQNLGLNHTKR